MSTVPLNNDADFQWYTVCKATEIVYETGVCAFINNIQIAIYRLRNNNIYALGNIDPYSDAGVLARGIVGSINGEPVVASPMYKQHFRLIDGVCHENSQISVATYKTRVVDGIISVALPTYS